MRATILSKAIMLTKANWAAVSIMAKGCIVVRVLSLRCFLFLLSNYTNINLSFVFEYGLRQAML